MKMHNSCFKNNHKPNGVVIRDAAEGAFLLSCPVLSCVPLLFLLSVCPRPLSVFALDLPAASLILTSTACCPTLARR